MNRAELAKCISQKICKTQLDANKMIEAFIEVVKDSMVKGDSVKIAGFGTFGVGSRKSRLARNPKTGEELIVPARSVPSFKPGRELKTLVNTSK